MRDVAALAGVSGKTVSRVINGDRYVSVAVRERVERAITELAYVPNMLSQTFRNGRDSAIGIAVPDVSDPFFAAVVQAVAELARSRSTAVLVTTLGLDPADEQPAVEALLRRHVAGLIIAPTSADQSYMKNWQSTTELVFIDRPPSHITADSVLEDDFAGARQAVEHLLRQGHRRIAFVAGGAGVVTVERRLDGYRAALTVAGLTTNPAIERLGAGPKLSQMLEQAEPPTAIFSANSQTSIELVLELNQLHRNDIELVSFGDFPMAAALDPPVTVLDQNPGLLGRTAAERLFDRIAQPGRRLKRQIVLPVDLLVREIATRATTPLTTGGPAGRIRSTGPYGREQQ